MAVRRLGSTDSEDSEDSEGEGGEEEDPGGGDGEAIHVSNGCGEQTEAERTLGDPSWADSPDLSSMSTVPSQPVAADTGAAVWDQPNSGASCSGKDENWASFTEPAVQQESSSKVLTDPAILSQEVAQNNGSQVEAVSSVPQDPPTPDTGPPEGGNPPNSSIVITVASTVELPPSTSDSTQPLQGTTDTPQPEHSNPQIEQQQQPAAR